MLNSFFELIIYSSASWYIAHAVTNTHGPFGVFEWIRVHLPLGGLTSCIICLAVWVALVLRFIGPNIVTDGLAIAGVALWLHGYTGWRHGS